MGQTEAIRDSFTSPNVSDSNGEMANMVDVIDRLASCTRAVAHSISPLDAAPYRTESGMMVSSLTEASLCISDSLSEIASAINNLADVMAEKNK